MWLSVHGDGGMVILYIKDGNNDDNGEFEGAK